MRRISNNEIKHTRQRALKVNSVCPLCGTHIEEDDAVLDHDHKTGECRGILHRGCNALLGKIENGRVLNGLTDDVRFETYCRNLMEYIKNAKMGFLHPTHRTDREKKELQKKRARKRAAEKRKEAKQKVNNENITD